MRTRILSAVLAISTSVSTPAFADTICEWMGYAEKVTQAGPAAPPGLPRSPEHEHALTQVALAMFDLVGEPVSPDASRGLSFHFRFEPNDLGHVAFRGERLANENGQLILKRFDRTIRFRRHLTPR